MDRWDKVDRRGSWYDSWYHYRHQVGLNPLYALYRTLYYETLKHEPWAPNPPRKGR